MLTDHLENITSLQKNADKIRNICILAHVDHGKTTIADSLVASNGIISQRMAGKLRYMDSREDEQVRGITMKSSAIALMYHHTDKSDYLINLIDSPGHIDFSAEVSTAVRLCDGAIVVVDVVESVCPQTIAALRQAWKEGLRPVLILNKIDRLILELKLDPLEAYLHIVRVLEQVNAVTGELFASEVMENIVNKEDSSTDSAGSCSKEVYEWSSGLEDADDSTLYFSPDQGNVLFASAYDGWGFNVGLFARLFSKKLGMSEKALQKTLWGDFYLNSKTKTIHRGYAIKGKKPLFVQFILENIWAVYDCVMSKNTEKTEKIVSSLGIKLSARDSQHKDARIQLQAVMSQWLPLSLSTLNMVVKHIPAPNSLSKERVERLLQGLKGTSAQHEQLISAFMKCSSDEDAPVVVFISKMFTVSSKLLPESKPRELTVEERAALRERAIQKIKDRQNKPDCSGNEEDMLLSTNMEELSICEEDEDREIFLAFARVFSGCVRPGQQLFVLGPRYVPNPDQPEPGNTLPAHVQKAFVEQLYVLMGRELSSLNEVPAGSVVGISGLEGCVLKTATLSSTLSCPAFTHLNQDVTPIVKVAVEPENHSDLRKLSAGLELLAQADPCVEVYVQENGEHVLAAAGEVHLQKCLDDLRDLFARVPISASEPLISFRETIVPPPEIDMVQEHVEEAFKIPEYLRDDPEVLGPGLVQITTPDGRCSLRIRAVPLPVAVSRLLENSVELLKLLDRASLLRQERSELLTLSKENISCIHKLKDDIQKVFDEAGSEWENITDRIWALGPRRTGPNLLINCIEDYDRPSIWDLISGVNQGELLTRLRELDGSIANGFQLAAAAGPLCEEPMMGVGYLVEHWKVEPLQVVPVESGTSQEDEGPTWTRHGPLFGQVMSCVKDSCRKSFQCQPQRLMEAMYTCQIQASSDVLGKLYAVVSRRRGQVQEEELREGSSMFDVTAMLPVNESFGFAEELRKKTSGFASPQLTFSHWQVLEVDPFWVPSTEEEIVHFGEKADSENVARKYMNKCRKRKGLFVEEQIIAKADKQRTLTKNK